MRRYEYQQRRSPSKVHSRRHGSRPQSHSTPTATKTSVIRANGCVQRTLHPSDHRVCVFQYSPETRPVEPRYLGAILEGHRQRLDPTEHPWYLNIRRFLHLNRVSVDNSVAYMTTHCYRRAPGFHVYEFGRHLYANRDGYLCTIEMWKTFRRSNSLLYSHEHSINDVLPKLRWFNLENKFEIINTLSVSGVFSDLKDNWYDQRWWHKYGREDGSRFYEWVSAKRMDRFGTVELPLHEIRGGEFLQWKIVKTQPHFGVYVADKAKLILRDTITTGYDYNHTLVQSGVFIAVQGRCKFAFMDNTQRVYELRDMRTATGGYLVGNPVIVVNAVPSIGESVCWGLTIEGETTEPTNPYTTTSWCNDESVLADERPVGMEAVLNVPLLGMNRQRMQIYDWDQGFEFVRQWQTQFNYGQYVRGDPNFALSEHDVRSAQFVPNEPLEYPRI